MKRKKSKSEQLINEDFIKKAARLLKGETLDDKDKYTYDLYKRKRTKYNSLGIDVWHKNDLWSIDLAEMKDLAGYNDNLRYILCVVDVYSRYAFVKLLKNKTSKNVGKKFEEILIEEKEIPKKIVSDEGRNFKIYEIDYRKITVFEFIILTIVKLKQLMRNDLFVL